MMTTKLPLLLAGCALFSALDATTVGYWRFETDTYTDSSGNGYNFQNASPANDLVRTAIPGTGNGSAFPATIPQTGASNSFMASYDSTDDFLSTATIDSSAATGVDTRKTFTFETYTNINRLSSNAFLASYWDGASSSRAWAVQLLNSGNKLNMLVSSNGSSYETAASDISLIEDTDYYIGIAVDLSSAVQADRKVTFYVQDLTNGSSLQTIVASNIAAEEINNVNHSLTLGDVSTGNFATRLDAQFDEVRFSNTALSPSELLVSIPEQSTYALIAGLGTLLCLARRRRLS